MRVGRSIGGECMLYYIHGYLSTPDGAKGMLFHQTLGATAIAYRRGAPEDLVISECLERIQKTLASDPNVQLIGSSLGGFLAAKTALHIPTVDTLILLNPALIPPAIDVSILTGMPLRIFHEMKDPALFTTKISAKLLVVLGTQDEVVPNAWGIEFAKAQEAQVLFLQDDHQLSRHLSQLPKLLSPFCSQKH